MTHTYKPTERAIKDDGKDGAQRDLAQLEALGKRLPGGMPDEKPSDNPLISMRESEPERQSHP